MKIFRFFGKLIGLLLILVIIFSTLASIFLLSFTTRLTKPEFYQEVFEEAAFIEQLPEIAAAQIHFSIASNPCLEDPDQCTDEQAGGGPPSYFQALSENDWERLLTELLPEDWLENQLDDLVSNLINSIKNGDQHLEVGISLVELKEHLSGESGVEAISNLMKAQPDCSDEDLLEMTRILEGRQEAGKDFLSCNPGNDFLDKYAPQIEVLLNRSLRDIPEEIDFTNNLPQKTFLVSSFGTDLPLPVFLKFIRWAILISPLLNLILLLVIALLAAGSFISLGKWWGYPLAISGLLGVVLASLVSPTANFLLKRFLPDSGVMGLHEKLVSAASNLGLQVLGRIFSQARNFALILAGIGLTIIITTAVLGKPASPPPADEIQDDSSPATPANQDPQESEP